MGNTFYLTLGQAAKETGKSKSVISKALNNGTLSYVEKTKAGYKIDPAELFRVFEPRTETLEKERSAPHKNTQEPIGNSVLQAKLDATELRYSDAEKTIAHLQRLLDDEREERKKLTERLLPVPNTQNFWSRLFGK